MGQKQTRTRRGWGSIRQRDGQFYARYTNPASGKETMRLLPGAHTLKDAERGLAVLRDEVEGLIRAPEQESHPSMRLTTWFVTEYAEVFSAQVAPGTMRAAGAHIQRLVNWLAKNGDPLMDRVTKPDAEKFVADMLGEGLKPSYIARTVTTLRRVWKDAAERKLVTRNPWVGVRLRRTEEREVPWVEPADLLILYRKTTESQRALLTVLGETGLRVGEGLALRWSDVDLGDRPSIHVRIGKSLAARRTVPLTQVACAALRELGVGDEDAVVFEKRAQFTVLRAIRRACRKARLPRLRVHDLRHLYASHLVRAGTQVTTVARLLGHADGGALVLRRYGRWAPKDAEETAVRRLQEWRRTRAQEFPAGAGRRRSTPAAAAT